MKALNNPPYTIQYIFDGKPFENNMKNYQDKPQTKALLLPFQDNETWKLLNDAFKVKQPNITAQPKKNEMPAELQYLSNLFLKVGNHKANKFIRWLHLIRELGTSGSNASMDINQIGKKCQLSNQQNGQQIYETFFNKTLPFMKELIRSMPKIFGSESKESQNESKQNDADDNVFFINPNSNDMIELTRGQIASILACCFLGIELYAHCSFVTELQQIGTPAKMECWLRYFDFVRQKGIESDWFSKEKVTVWRRCLSAEQCACLKYNSLIKNETELCDFVVYEEGCIEDQSGQLQADFANQYIGGGVLEGGNVQEEIRFTVNTECLISKWLCPLPMRHNESIIIMGSQQFFNYSGYGSSFCFDGYRDNENEMFFCQNKADRLGSSAIIGIDALYLFAPKSQITANYMMREITKSFVGYSIGNDVIGHKMDVISTGNWGCGIFRGDPQLKSMIQWISATLSGRSIAYYTFSDRRVAGGKLKEFIEEMKKQKFTVGRLWKVLMDPGFGEFYNNGTVFNYIRSCF